VSAARTARTRSLNARTYPRRLAVLPRARHRALTSRTDGQRFQSLPPQKKKPPPPPSPAPVLALVHNIRCSSRPSSSSLPSSLVHGLASRPRARTSASISSCRYLPESIATDKFQFCEPAGRARSMPALEASARSHRPQRDRGRSRAVPAGARTSRHGAPASSSQ